MAGFLIYKMKDFTKPNYLKSGNPKQKKIYHIVNELRIFEILHEFKPVIVGTIPIEIDLPNSDIDIICEVKDLQKFKILLTKSFNAFDSFVVKEKLIRGIKTVITSFVYLNFKLEFFGQDKPTIEQYAYRHMIIEHQILKQKPELFRQRIIELKYEGYNTEEAFAELLNLKGDPFEALLLIDLNSINE